MDEILLKASSEIDPEADGIIRKGALNAGRAFTQRNPISRSWIVARGEDGTLSGGARILLSSGWAKIEAIWVTPSVRRKGLGSKLLLRAEDIAREAKCIGLEISAKSYDSPEFFLARGFKQVARLPGPTPESDAFWFAKFFLDEGTPELSSPPEASPVEADMPAPTPRPAKKSRRRRR